VQEGLQDYLRSHGVEDERLAMSTTCLYNPGACGKAMADVAASVVRSAVPVVEAAGAAAATTLRIVSMLSPLAIPGDSVQVVRIDPTKPAKDVLPGSLRREYPGEYLDKSLNQVKDLLKGAKGQEKNALQKAKKLLEQAERLLGKNKG
jgi:hypothetical protein